MFTMPRCNYQEARHRNEVGRFDRLDLRAKSIVCNDVDEPHGRLQHLLFPLMKCLVHWMP